MVNSNEFWFNYFFFVMKFNFNFFGDLFIKFRFMSFYCFLNFLLRVVEYRFFNLKKFKIV